MILFSRLHDDPSEIRRRQISDLLLFPRARLKFEVMGGLCFIRAAQILLKERGLQTSDLRTVIRLFIKRGEKNSFQPAQFGLR